jgi:predicted DNA binding CopG/RHH family protein
MEPASQQVSIRLPITDLKLAQKLARRKGISKYQTYLMSLLHDTLVKEAAGEG